MNKRSLAQLLHQQTPIANNLPNRKKPWTISPADKKTHRRNPSRTKPLADKTLPSNGENLLMIKLLMAKHQETKSSEK